MKHGVAKFILQFLLPEQKEHYVAVANDLIKITTNVSDFLMVITRNKWWVYGHDLEMKAQSSQWKSSGSPHPKRAQQSCSTIKTILTVFFDWEDVVHHVSALPDQTVNKGHYLNVLCQLRDAI